MKEVFFEYHQPKLDKNVLEEATIVLDANALLNVYRYDSILREKYFEILTIVKNNIFLTHQGVKEFYDNRMKIIYNKAKFKDNLIEELSEEVDSIINRVKNAGFKKEPSKLINYESNLKEEINKKLEVVKEEIIKQIQEQQIDIEEKYIYDDTILEKMLELFNKRVNCEIDSDTKSKIYEEGEKRYSKQIPPGYEDAKKDEEQKYGDLLVWKEIINIGIDKKTDVILVSDDRKEDWVEKFKGKDLGPRKELIREFKDQTQKNFYSITTKNFIEIVSKYYDIANTEELIDITEKIEIESEKANNDFLSDTKLTFSKKYKKKLDNSLFNNYLTDYQNVQNKWVQLDFMKYDDPEEYFTKYEKEDALKNVSDKLVRENLDIVLPIVEALQPIYEDDINSLIPIGARGLISAADDYVKNDMSEQGISFEEYAHTVIRNKILGYILENK